MPKPRRPWIVTKHGPIEKLDDNLWGVESNVPGVPMPRRMCIARMADGKLAFFHAVPLEEGALQQVRSLGTPAYLVVGHDQHVVDAHAFAEKLGLKVYGPKEREAQLRTRVDLAGTLESFPGDATVQVEAMPGTKTGEALMRVTSGGQRLSVLFTDAIMNVRHGSLLFRLIGMTGSPKCTPIFRMFFISDRKALKAGFERLAALPNLTRLVPCHGEVVQQDAAGTLRAVAATL